ncbi:hypothetical protein AB0B51_21475, partial [Streptomyces griseus]
LAGEQPDAVAVGQIPRREAMGRAARERAADYRWTASVRRFAAVAAEATAGAGALTADAPVIGASA